MMPARIRSVCTCPGTVASIMSVGQFGLRVQGYNFQPTELRFISRCAAYAELAKTSKYLVFIIKLL